eukprot:tig00021234_g19431.t1
MLIVAAGVWRSAAVHVRPGAAAGSVVVSVVVDGETTLEDVLITDRTTWDPAPGWTFRLYADTVASYPEETLITDLMVEEYDASLRDSVLRNGTLTVRLPAAVSSNRIVIGGADATSSLSCGAGLDIASWGPAGPAAGTSFSCNATLRLEGAPSLGSPAFMSVQAAGMLAGVPSPLLPRSGGAGTVSFNVSLGEPRLVFERNFSRGGPWQYSRGESMAGSAVAAGQNLTLCPRGASGSACRGFYTFRPQAGSPDTFIATVTFKISTVPMAFVYGNVPVDFADVNDQIFQSRSLSSAHTLFFASDVGINFFINEPNKYVYVWKQQTLINNHHYGAVPVPASGWRVVKFSIHRDSNADADAVYSIEMDGVSITPDSYAGADGAIHQRFTGWSPSPNWGFLLLSDPGTSTAATNEVVVQSVRVESQDRHPAAPAAAGAAVVALTDGSAGNGSTIAAVRLDGAPDLSSRLHCPLRRLLASSSDISANNCTLELRRSGAPVAVDAGDLRVIADGTLVGSVSAFGGFASRFSFAFAPTSLVFAENFTSAWSFARSGSSLTGTARVVSAATGPYLQLVPALPRAGGAWVFAPARVPRFFRASWRYKLCCGKTGTGPSFSVGYSSDGFAFSIGAFPLGWNVTAPDSVLANDGKGHIRSRNAGLTVRLYTLWARAGQHYVHVYDDLGNIVHYQSAGLYTSATDNALTNDPMYSMEPLSATRTPSRLPS